MLIPTLLYIVAFVLVIDLTTEEATCQPIEYWLKDLQVYIEEKKILLEGGWLSDNLITAVQRLLKDSYPHIGGLQPPILGETLTFEVRRGKFVKVLNVYGSHWITISNLLCSSGVVAVCDSKPDCTLSNQTKRQIVSILMTDEEAINIQIVKVQAQMGTSDCGLFSLAFAT